MFVIVNWDDVEKLSLSLNDKATDTTKTMMIMNQVKHASICVYAVLIPKAQVTKKFLLVLVYVSL